MNGTAPDSGGEPRISRISRMAKREGWRGGFREEPRMGANGREWARISASPRQIHGGALECASPLLFFICVYSRSLAVYLIADDASCPARRGANPFALGRDLRQEDGLYPPPMRVRFGPSVRRRPSVNIYIFVDGSVEMWDLPASWILGQSERVISPVLRL